MSIGRGSARNLEEQDLCGIAKFYDKFICDLFVLHKCYMMAMYVKSEITVATIA